MSYSVTLKQTEVKPGTHLYILNLYYKDYVFRINIMIIINSRYIWRCVLSFSSKLDAGNQRKSSGIQLQHLEEAKANHTEKNVVSSS